MKRNNFKVGDRVEHMSGSKGTVTKITDAVHVAFDQDYRGEYDDHWFRTYPNGLTIQQTPGA